MTMVMAMVMLMQIIVAADDGDDFDVVGDVGDVYGSSTGASAGVVDHGCWF